jgi:tRNA(Ile)-lysidine synthase TilS/MesJ
MKACKICVLDERFPGVTIGEEGICKFCCSSKKDSDQKLLKQKYEAKFTDLIQKYKGTSIYDCLVAYSGGKDSTFTLHVLLKRYHLNILALSFDNWFQSECAHHNIQNVIRNMNVDHVMFRPNFEIFRKMMQVCISEGFYSPKALERASAICTTCLSLIRFTAFKIAIEKSIPFVIFGLSPGQAPIATSVFRTNPGMTKKMQNAIYQPLYEHIGEPIKPYFLEEKHFENKENFPYSINPLAFSEYNETAIFEIAQSYGWVKPEDTDANSTNCLLNGLANEIHLKQHGFHPYAFEIAGLVREGCMTREEGLARLSVPPNPTIMEDVREKLKIEDEF